MMLDGPVHLDVDTGIDDAIAIAFAKAAGANLVGVSTLAGNVPIDQVVRNTLNVLHQVGADDVPVYRGASRPLVATYQDASHVHGGNGLGGVDLQSGPAVASDIAGPASIIRAAAQHDGDLTLVTLGPLTNLAIALNVRPEISRQIRRVVVMGGACFVPGNVTPQAEFNVYVDPHAANQVFEASWNRLTLVGLDVTHQVTIARSSWERMGERDGRAANLVRAIVARTFLERDMTGFYLHDPLAVGVALDDAFITTEAYAVRVVEEGDARGRTIATKGAATFEVATGVDAQGFLGFLSVSLGLGEMDHMARFDRSE